MNQEIKRCVYALGNQSDVAYIANVCGMDDTEAAVLQMWHDKRDDQFIMDSIGCGKNSFRLIEKCVRLKLAIGVMQCIHRCKELDNN